MAVSKTRKKPRTKRAPASKARPALSMAQRADRYSLYQRSVQDPPADIEFMVDVFRSHFGRAPRDLREDFCAAAFLACTWVREHRENRAWGIDLDPEPLAWGLAHNAAKLTPAQRARLQLIEGDVLSPPPVKVDIVTAQNFSYFTFKTRETLRAYFQRAREGLEDEGILVLDLFGGPDSQTRMRETTEYGRFSYVWDQHRYDPINNAIECHIDYKFPDGSRLRRAFSYDWRMWTIPEVRELLAEAGFSRSEAYWEGTDPKTGEGSGEFTKRDQVENERAWIAYIVGIK